MAGLNSISQEKFKDHLKKAMDDLKVATTRIQCNRIECELTEAYLNVEGDNTDIMFRVNIVARYEFVMGMIAKKGVELLFKGVV